MLFQSTAPTLNNLSPTAVEGTARGAKFALVNELTYGQLTAALYAADIPKGKHVFSESEVKNLIMQGLDRLGFDALSAKATEAEGTDQWFRLQLAKSPERLRLEGTTRKELQDDYETAKQELWPDTRKHQRCLGLASKFEGRHRFNPRTGRPYRETWAGWL